MISLRRNWIFIFNCLLLLSCCIANKPYWQSVRYESGPGLFMPGKVFTLVIDEKNIATVNINNSRGVVEYYSRLLGKNELDALKFLLKKINESSLKEDYNSSAEDTPLKILTYRINNKSKAFKFKGPVPPLLQKTDSLMQQIASSNAWQKIKK